MVIYDLAPAVFLLNTTSVFNNTECKILIMTQTKNLTESVIRAVYDETYRQQKLLN